MSTRPYMAEPWFALLQAACEQETPTAVAQRLAVTGSLVSQVRNGSGFYGKDSAPAPRAFAARVLGVYGSWRCPHLSEQYEEDRVLTADECRAYAHRPASISGPRDAAHWRACHACPQKALTAQRPQSAVVQRPKTRKPKPGKESTSHDETRPS